MPLIWGAVRGLSRAEPGGLGGEERGEAGRRGRPSHLQKSSLFLSYAHTALAGTLTSGEGEGRSSY